MNIPSLFGEPKGNQPVPQDILVMTLTPTNCDLCNRSNNLCTLSTCVSNNIRTENISFIYECHIAPKIGLGPEFNSIQFKETSRLDYQIWIRQKCYSFLKQWLIYYIFIRSYTLNYSACNYECQSKRLGCHSLDCDTVHCDVCCGISSGIVVVLYCGLLQCFSFTSRAFSSENGRGKKYVHFKIWPGKRITGCEKMYAPDQHYLYFAFKNYFNQRCAFYISPYKKKSRISY